MSTLTVGSKISIFLAITLLCAGCGKQASTVPLSNIELPPRLNSYFEEYCDYTGGLGIGFNPSHTYDYRFRQRLKTTQDPELKRLLVLQHLYRDVEVALGELKSGVVRIGKDSYRPLTLSEWQSTRQSIQTQIDDLATYSAFTNFAKATRDPFDHQDPNLESGWIEELLEKLQSLTNAPTSPR